MRFLRPRNFRIGSCIVIGVCICALVLLIVVSRTPAGTFECPKVAAIGPTYLRFGQGKVTLVLPEQKECLGIYTNRLGRWIWTTQSGNELYLVPGLIRLRVFDGDGAEVDGYSNLKRVWFYQ
jgi:hypothetical protein